MKANTARHSSAHTQISMELRINAFELEKFFSIIPIQQNGGLQQPTISVELHRYVKHICSVMRQYTKFLRSSPFMNLFLHSSSRIARLFHFAEPSQAGPAFIPPTLHITLVHWYTAKRSICINHFKNFGILFHSFFLT